MFSDYLYQQISKGLIEENQLFPKDGDLSLAIELIKDNKPITTNTKKDIIARYLFAITLKTLLEDPEADLSLEIRSNSQLQSALKDLYLKSLTRVEEYLGIKTAQMLPDGPFVGDFKELLGIEPVYLSEGTFGAVYKYNNIALKSFKHGLEGSEIKEVAILRYLNHPNVINVIGLQLDPPTLAMPYADLGSLKGFQYTTDTRKSIFYQLFRGLAYCHSMHVWHRDLKPANILLFTDSRGNIVAKLADFGWAIYYPYPQQSKSTLPLRIGTALWRAPEVLLGDTAYSELVDVWSLGVMFVESYLKSYLLPGRNISEQLLLAIRYISPVSQTYLSKARDLPNWKHMFEVLKMPPRRYQAEAKLTPQAIELAHKTIVWPTERYTALEVLKLPYFDKVGEKVDLRIKAAPIIIKPCAEVMLENQAELTINENTALNNYIQSSRADLINKLWDLRQLLTYQSVFYIFMLADQLMSKYADQFNDYNTFMVSLIGITNDLLSNNKLPPSTVQAFVKVFNPDFSTGGDIDDLNYTLTEFKFVKPSTYDFLREYMGEFKFPKTATIIYEKIYGTAKNLILNYDYVKRYTQSELAIIALQANIELFQGTPACIKDKKQLYNKEIAEYLFPFDL